MTKVSTKVYNYSRLKATIDLVDYKINSTIFEMALEGFGYMHIVNYTTSIQVSMLNDHS